MSITNNKLSAAQYEQNFSDIHPPFETKEAALVEANRCLFCYDAPCTKSCPTSINVPKFIKQISTDNVKGSAHTIFMSNIMGGGCSKVCPVEKLCEGACVFNLMHEPPIPIARLQRYSTEKAISDKWKLFEACRAYTLYENENFKIMDCSFEALQQAIPTDQTSIFVDDTHYFLR